MSWLYQRQNSPKTQEVSLERNILPVQGSPFALATAPWVSQRLCRKQWSIYGRQLVPYLYDILVLDSSTQGACQGGSTEPTDSGLHSQQEKVSSNLCKRLNSLASWSILFKWRFFLESERPTEVLQELLRQRSGCLLAELGSRTPPSTNMHSHHFC